MKSMSNIGPHAPFPMQCKAEKVKAEKVKTGRTSRKVSFHMLNSSRHGCEGGHADRAVPCAGFVAEEARTSFKKEVSPPNKRYLSEEFHKLCKEHPWF